MPKTPTVVVLLGPPGSGKSSIAAALTTRGLRWCDWEAVLLERWGSTENFIAHKERALAQHDEERIAFIEEGGSAAVLETTGISDSAFIDGLERFQTLTVRLDVSADEALRRIAARAAGQHFSDNVEMNRAVWQRFYDVVAPRRRCHLFIDTERMSIDEAADVIASAS